MKYSVTTVWSEEDGYFVSTSMEFPYLSGFGDTPDRATAQLWEIIQDAIEILAEDGEEIPTPQVAKNYSGQIRLRMPVSLHEKLTKMAEREGVSLNSYILTLLQGGSSKEELALKVIESLHGVISDTSDMAKTVIRLSEVESQRIKYSGEKEPQKGHIEPVITSEGKYIVLTATHGC